MAVRSAETKPGVKRSPPELKSEPNPKVVLYITFYPKCTRFSVHNAFVHALGAYARAL